MELHQIRDMLTHAQDYLDIEYLSRRDYEGRLQETKHAFAEVLPEGMDFVHFPHSNLIGIVLGEDTSAHAEEEDDEDDEWDADDEDEEEDPHAHEVRFMASPTWQISITTQSGTAPIITNNALTGVGMREAVQRLREQEAEQERLEKVAQVRQEIEKTVKQAAHTKLFDDIDIKPFWSWQH